MTWPLSWMLSLRVKKFDPWEFAEVPPGADSFYRLATSAVCLAS